MEALELFVSAYGAECGNLALRAVTTRGLYVGGGIAPKILPAMQTGLFLDSFCAKPPMRGPARSIPVKVILNPQAGLLGAAVYANAEVHGLVQRAHGCAAGPAEISVRCPAAGGSKRLGSAISFSTASMSLGTKAERFSYPAGVMRITSSRRM